MRINLPARRFTLPARAPFEPASVALEFGWTRCGLRLLFATPICPMPPASDPHDVTLLLEAAGRGDAAAGAQLLPLVYNELRRLAAIRMAREADGHTLQPTALVHEAWLRLAGSGDRHWQNRAHFFRVAALAMRRILVEHARRRAREKRGANPERINLDNVTLFAADQDERVLLVDQALERLEQLDADAARVVTLKFFGNYTTQEIAEILDSSPRSIERQWTHARARLMRLIRESA
jgi:RNA polymerase sigma factor (TIGR02999 family)